MKASISHKRSRAACVALALAGVSLSLGGCMHNDRVATTVSAPDDYRLRHPIAIEEANHSIVVFVGKGRGGLSAELQQQQTELQQSGGLEVHVDEEHQMWPFDGEYWRDELGFYRQQVTSRCGR